MQIPNREGQHLSLIVLFKPVSAYIKRKMALIVPFLAGSLRLYINLNVRKNGVCFVLPQQNNSLRQYFVFVLHFNYVGTGR